MKYTNLIPLVVGATAFVLPDRSMQFALTNQPDEFETLARGGNQDGHRNHRDHRNHREHHDHGSDGKNRGLWGGGFPGGNGVLSSIGGFVDDVAEGISSTIDNAIHALNNAEDYIGRKLGNSQDEPEGRRRHRGGRGRNRGSNDEDNDDDENRHDRGRNRDSTVWDIIKENDSTRQFVKLIEEYEDLKELLKDTQGERTVFVPTDDAFEDFPREGDRDRPSKEAIREILEYHIVQGYRRIERVGPTHTLPTELELRSLGDMPQRLRVAPGVSGIWINFNSLVTEYNVEASNGVLHAVDRLLIPPPRQGQLIETLPEKFSTFALAMKQTGLGEELHRRHQRGGTVFAPHNDAWSNLGRYLNEFLFSRDGRKYLRALLKYHIAENQTLYSDRFYDGENNDNGDHGRNGRHDGDRNRDRDGDNRRDRDGDRNRDRDGDDRRDRDGDRNRDRDDEDRRRHRNGDNEDRRHHRNGDNNRDRDDEDRRHHRNGDNDRDRDGDNRRHHRNGDNDRDRDGDNRRHHRSGDNNRDRDDEDRRHHRNGDNDRDRDGDNRRNRDRDGDGKVFPSSDSWEVRLNSLLADKIIVVQHSRWLGAITMKVNDRIKVSVQDGIADDGVVQVIDSVLLPPRHRQPSRDDRDDYENDNLSVRELQELLEPYIDDEDRDRDRNRLGNDL